MRPETQCLRNIDWDNSSQESESVRKIPVEGDDHDNRDNSQGLQSYFVSVTWHMLPHQIGVSAGNQSNRDHMQVQKYAVSQKCDGTHQEYKGISCEHYLDGYHRVSNRQNWRRSACSKQSSHRNMKMQDGWSEGFPPLFTLVSECQCLLAYPQHQNQDLDMHMRPAVTRSWP